MAPTPEQPSQPPLPPSATVVPLRSKSLERVFWIQKAQHAIPATALLPAGLRSLMGGAHGFELALAIAEILVSAWLLRLVVTEFRGTFAGAGGRVESPPHHGIDWAHFAAASMITVEVLGRWHTHHRWSRPLILTAVVTFALALLHGRMTRFRESRMNLRFDCESITWRPRRTRRRFTARFDEVERFEIGASRAVLGTASGKEGVVDLDDLRNHDEVRTALEAAREIWRARIATRDPERRDPLAGTIAVGEREPAPAEPLPVPPS